MGSWMRPARKLAQRLQTAGNGRPVWLFSSGPVGDPPLPAEHPVDVTHVQELTKNAAIACSAASSLGRSYAFENERLQRRCEYRRAISGTGMTSGRGPAASPTICRRCRVTHAQTSTCSAHT